MARGRGGVRIVFLFTKVATKQDWTRLRMAPKWRKDGLPIKLRKWEGFAISLICCCLARIPVSQEHPRWKKHISAWKKLNAFFSRGASFLAKVSHSEAKTSPFRGWKAVQILICVRFWASLILICWPTDCKKLSCRFYFAILFCKRFGIIFLYIMVKDLGHFLRRFWKKKARSVVNINFL